MSAIRSIAALFCLVAVASCDQLPGAKEKAAPPAQGEVAPVPDAATDADAKPEGDAAGAKPDAPPNKPE
jgi:hypothetical protein